MRTLILKFYALVPDKHLKDIVIQLDPYSGEIRSPSPYFQHDPTADPTTPPNSCVKRMWRIGRETEGNRLGADIILSGNKYLSRAQATIRYDESDRSWHIHDGFLMREREDMRWAYSSHGVYVNGHRLVMGEWEPITKPGTRINLGGFEDAKILVLTNINDQIHKEDWTWGIEPTEVPQLTDVDKELSDEVPNEQITPNKDVWYASIAKDLARWIQTPGSLWGAIYRLLIIAVGSALIIILMSA